ncbi:uncharacterized protein B0I36DRAFT_150143 [Microdochium trichocladiopsis]|uniref:Uncharacterized protein n=1 Tax=Microdochium trichocladiopsis TaxID=1682393 RepID=A0A9P9BQH2_9PEZI|nr:uncharacterized protein B0I36DRAFT_150143 [Microdochium trichocladiopsis]KAH7025872.1 hypothetical protein B0I36DRAFT_150143 [Microdochium trichocladiopsis]
MNSPISYSILTLSTLNYPPSGDSYRSYNGSRHVFVEQNRSGLACSTVDIPTRPYLQTSADSACRGRGQRQCHPGAPATHALWRSPKEQGAQGRGGRIQRAAWFEDGVSSSRDTGRASNHEIQQAWQHWRDTISTKTSSPLTLVRTPAFAEQGPSSEGTCISIAMPTFEPRHLGSHLPLRRQRGTASHFIETSRANRARGIL